jgi:hypothetical protein
MIHDFLLLRGLRGKPTIRSPPAATLSGALGA